MEFHSNGPHITLHPKSIPDIQEHISWHSILSVSYVDIHVVASWEANLGNINQLDGLEPVCRLGEINEFGESGI